jgi:bacterioferritin-associated ferredoxin
MHQAQFTVVSPKDRQSYLREDRLWLATRDLRYAAINRPGRASPGFTTEEPELSQAASKSVRFSHDFSQIPIFPNNDTRIQAKLSIGQLNDFYEQEADRVAEHVMRMPEPQIQRACACGGLCPSCRVDPPGTKSDHLQRSGGGKGESARFTASPILNEVLSSSGQPLDTTTRAFMEPRFGHDFSQVRIHAGASAAESARQVDAFAYTTGHHVVFGAGQYQPATNDGKRLLAHELVHVVQQSGGLCPAFHRPSEHTAGPSESKGPPATKKPLDSPSGEGKPALSTCLRPVLQRWKISGNDATADQHDDTLPALAEAVGARSNDWKCIRPVRMSMAESTAQPADFNERYERHVAVGDTFDVSNLTEWAGPMIAIHLFAATNKYTRLINKFYPGSIAVTDVDSAIGAASRLGTTPIADMVIVGHAHGGAMFGDASVFTPREFNSEQPSPTFAATQLGILPRRCWFTRSARVRSVGCDSEAWGQDFASHFLRQGAIVTTTTASVRGRCIGITMASLPKAGECDELDSFDFAACFFVDCPLLEGPFGTVEDFHAGTYWSDIGGKL